MLKEKVMKKTVKKVLCVILALLCAIGALGFVGCDSGSGDASVTTDSVTTNIPTTATPTTETPAATTTATGEAPVTPTVSYNKVKYNMADIESKINILGRCPVTEEGLYADWSASGFEFVADCKNMIKITVTSTHDCRFNFYLDDNDLKVVNISAGTKTYTVAANLEAGEHSFRFVKSSMVETGTKALAVNIESVEIYGEIKEAQQREYYVEFVGDSITCGVGASSSASTEAYSELSYAYLTANKLNADYSLVSISGIGAGKSTDRHNGLLMGQVYSLNNYYRSKTDKYEANRKADLVVINLNTNDRGSFDDVSMKDQFVAKVKDLIDQVKAMHGEDVKIVWVMGMMQDPTRLYVDLWTIQYLNSLGGEAAGYYYFVTEKNNQGASSHPIASAHARVSDELVEYITSKGILG